MNPEACCSSSCCYSSLQRTVRNYSRPSLAIRMDFFENPPVIPYRNFFSKTHQSSLTLKGGSTAFPKPLFSWRRLATLGKVQASLTLLSFAQPFPSGDRGCANRPTRCSNRFAIRLADHQRSSPAAELQFAVCDRMDKEERNGCRKPKKPIAARHEVHSSSL